MTRKSAPVAEPETEDAQEATAEPVGKLTTQMTDAEIMAAIEEQRAANAKAAASAPARVSVETIFNQSVALVAAATGKRFRNDLPVVSENTAAKLYELALMWALNNRDTVAGGQVLAPEEQGTTDDGPVGPEIIHETIGGTPAETE